MEAITKKLTELIDARDNFEVSDHVDESDYDDMLDDCYGDVQVAGMCYCTSRALKELDPIAYRCGFSDYCDSIELDDFAPYAELIEEIEEAAEAIVQQASIDITYSVTYDTVTPESAEDGEAAESGFYEEDEPLDLDADDVLQAAESGDIEGYLAQKIADVLEDYGATQYAGNGASWYTVDAEIDHRTGESTTRAVHFKGLDASLIAAVNAAI